MMKQLRKKRQEDAGFTLVELLIVIVIIGILAAVVVLAVGGITKSGSDSACTASKDAAEAASVAYYAGVGLQTNYPTSFAQMTGTTPPLLKLSNVSNVTATTADGKGWRLTLANGGATETTFSCGVIPPAGP